MEKMMKILETMQAEVDKQYEEIEEKYGGEGEWTFLDGYTEAMDYHEGFRDAVQMLEKLMHTEFGAEND